MIGLYILFCFCQQLKNTQSFFQLRCMRFSQAVFNSNSSCDLLPCDSHSVTGSCQNYWNHCTNQCVMKWSLLDIPMGTAQERRSQNCVDLGASAGASSSTCCHVLNLRLAWVRGGRDEQGQGHQAASVFPGLLCDTEGAVKGGEAPV